MTKSALHVAREKKKERKQTTQGRDGRTARRHHTGILRRGVWCASRRPPLGVRLFLCLFAVSLRFSLQSSCHLAVAPFSSCSPLSLLPLSRRSPFGAALPIRKGAGSGTWSTWSAVISLTSRAGGLRITPSEPDDRDRALFSSVCVHERSKKAHRDKRLIINT